MTTSLASSAGWPVALAQPPVDRGTRLDVGAEGGGARRHARGVLGLMDDAAMLLLLAWLAPLTILVVGMPIVLVVRLLIEITKLI